MAYIGHNANGNFTTKPSKDTFSGDGSTTAFTLSEGATTNTVDVFVENVRQEPTTAYTVDGTTLTFTAAPGSGTNNIYVVNRGPLQLSATHPAAQALEASTGTFTGALSGVAATFTGDLTVDTNTLYVDSTNNRVGVGTALPSKDLHLGASKELRLQTGSTTYDFTPTAGGTDQLVINSSLTTFYDFKMGGTTKASITTNGITFNGDTAAANALNDYEEGTWTPAVTQGWTSVSYTNSQQFGRYTKIGNMVTAWFYLRFSGTSAGNAIAIGGLPFTTPNASDSELAHRGGALTYFNVPVNAAGNISPYTTSGATSIAFYALDDGGASVLSNANAVNNYLIGSVTYWVE